MSESNPTVPYGYCYCGCGRKTNLARQNHAKQGLVRGEPLRYVQGHGNAQFRSVREDPSTHCWLWLGALSPEGPIPAEMDLDHLCRNSERCFV